MRIFKIRIIGFVIHSLYAISAVRLLLIYSVFKLLTLLLLICVNEEPPQRRRSSCSANNTSAKVGEELREMSDRKTGNQKHSHWVARWLLDTMFIYTLRPFWVGGGGTKQLWACPESQDVVSEYQNQINNFYHIGQVFFFLFFDFMCLMRGFVITLYTSPQR